MEYARKSSLIVTTLPLKLKWIVMSFWLSGKKNQTLTLPLLYLPNSTLMSSLSVRRHFHIPMD